MTERTDISLQERIARFRRGSYIHGYNVDAGESASEIRDGDVEAVAAAYIADLKLQETWKFCPECPPVIGQGLFVNRPRCRTGVKMVLSDKNYSGTGVDMYNCPKCGKGFAVSYNVAAVVHDPSWDVDPKENQ